MIRLTCTHCQKVLSVDEAFAGGVCRCRYCGTIQTVPKATGGAGSAAGKPPKILYRAGATGEPSAPEAPPLPPPAVAETLAPEPPSHNPPMRGDHFRPGLLIALAILALLIALVIWHLAS